MGELGRGTVRFATGQAILRAINYPFDYILYPIILLSLGSVTGGLLMFLLSLIFNVVIIQLYDWSKVDWLLLEKIKQMQQRDDSDGWWMRVLHTVRKNKVLTFLVLCIDDPVTVTLYFREGSYQFNGLRARDWRIFLAATVVSNLYWVLGWVGVIEFFRWILGGS
jgi:hypothetical protein